MEKYQHDLQDQMDLNSFLEQVGKLSQAINENTSPLPALDISGLKMDCLEQAKEIQDYCAESGFAVNIIH